MLKKAVMNVVWILLVCLSPTVSITLASPTKSSPPSPESVLCIRFEVQQNWIDAYRTIRADPSLCETANALLAQWGRGLWGNNPEGIRLVTAEVLQRLQDEGYHCEVCSDFEFVETLDGESLNRMASRYGYSLRYLAELNGIPTSRLTGGVIRGLVIPMREVSYDDSFEPKPSPTPEPTEQIVVPKEQGSVELVDSSSRMQVSFNPEGAREEGIQKAILRLAAELNRTSVEQIEQDLRQGKLVECEVRHLQYNEAGKLVSPQPVSHVWDLSKSVVFNFWNNNWGGGISPSRRTVIDVRKGSLILNIWIADTDDTFDNRWMGTGAVLEALWRVSLQGRQSELDPWSVDRMKSTIINLIGAWGPEGVPLIDVSRN